MFSVITNIYNKKTKGPSLMELFTATGKLKKFFFDKYRVIHKSVKQFKNSQQIDYATDHGNSYADRERETVEVFFKEKPVHIVALICR